MIDQSSNFGKHGLKLHPDITSLEIGFLYFTVEHELVSAACCSVNRFCYPWRRQSDRSCRAN